MNNDKQYRQCDACMKEFEIDEHDPYQRICDGCEGAADDYAQQREEMLMEAREATFVDVEDR